VDHADEPDEQTAARRAAVAEAGHRGDAVAARAGLADGDPIVRATALGALRRAGSLGAPDLAAALDDRSPVVRQRAAEEVAALAAAGPVPDGVSLLGLLDDADATVVEVAAWAAGERQPPEPGAVDRLATLVTGHDDALVREAAVAALGAIGDPAGLAAILTATGDKATVRRRAVIALAPFSGPDVDAALSRATSDRDWQVRQAAEDQLR
jgi:HEAT repeat protein